MTIPLDATLTTAIGAALYTAAKDHILAPPLLPEMKKKSGKAGKALPERKKRPPAASRPLLTSPYYLWGMVYNVIVGMGIAVSAYVLNPDWMWMYWLDASRLSVAFTVYVFMMYPAMFTLGFLLADQAEKLWKNGSLRLFLLLLAGLFLLIFLTFNRIWNVGTSSQWDTGACVPLIGPGFSPTPLAWVLLIGLVGAVVSLIWVWKRFARGLA